MIETLLGITAGVGLGAWILSPMRRRGADRTPLPDTRWSELVEAKHAVYRSILDLELDRSVGRVSEEDHRILCRQHEGEALAILAEMDEMQTTDTASTDILEAEIAAARRRIQGDGR
ncbi:MAG: hypothetical protein ACRDJF_10415 [Actinomycetota bacterium]